MKKNRTIAGWLMLLALSTLNLQPSTCFAQGTAFTYQGRLNSGANPATGIYDLRFTIYDAAGGGNAGGVLTNAAASVTNGLFTATLDFGSGVFDGNARWLEIAVRTNGAASFTPLTPRQPVTPAPYAILAGTAGGLAGTLPVSQVSGVMPLAQLPVAVMTNNATGVTLSGNLFGNFGGSFFGNGAGLTGLNPANLSAGTAAINISGNAATATAAITAANLTGYVTDAQLPAGIARLNEANNFTGTNAFAGITLATNFNNVLAGTFLGNGASLTNLAAWQLAGNAGTSPAGNNFLGTADNQPLEFRVNNVRALRLEPTINDANHSNAVNVIAGAPVNYVAPGVAGATIGGGGTAFYGPVTLASNSVSADYATIGGGFGNTIQSNAIASVIGGGVNNLVQTNSRMAAIGGGQNNLIQTNAGWATIGGGAGNVIQSNASYATIPGGSQNIAGGTYSFAAGKGARATNSGDFVWSDASFGNFSSTTSNQFNVRANGGVRIMTGGAGMTLDGQSVLTLAGGGFWQLGGNSGTSPDVNYLGTADDQPLVLGVAGQPALTLGVNSSIGLGAITNSGFGSISLGLGTTASGYTSVALGNGTTASSYTSTALGGYTTATNTYATAMGSFTTAGGNSSIAMGSYSRAVGDYSTALGEETTASGIGSTAMGGYTAATNQFSTAIGCTTTAGGFASTAIGIGSVATGSSSLAAGMGANALHDNSFVWGGSGGTVASTGPGQFIVQAPGGVGINKNNPASALDVEGTVTATTFNPTSDRNAKEKFTPIQAREVLEKVATLPILEWSFKNEPATRHVGPMAQDFHGAFGLGIDDKHIATVDADGVALAAIQGLDQKLEQKETEIAELKARLEKLEQLVNAINGGAE